MATQRVFRHSLLTTLIPVLVCACFFCDLCDSMDPLPVFQNTPTCSLATCCATNMRWPSKALLLSTALLSCVNPSRLLGITKKCTGACSRVARGIYHASTFFLIRRGRTRSHAKAASVIPLAQETQSTRANSRLTRAPETKYEPA